jgi:SagB-type dehydrogenase family enzyme
MDGIWERDGIWRRRFMERISIVKILVVISLGVVTSFILLQSGGDGEPSSASLGDVIKLPEPDRIGEVPLESALQKRRSHRAYSDEPLAVGEVSQILWAAYGVTDPRGLRTAPSAGALYPLEVYLVAGDVEDIPPGAYRYRPHDHELSMVREGDIRPRLYDASLRQSFVRDAPALLVISAVYERTTGRYGERGERYVHMEAGHAGQNVLLAAASLDLGAVPVGAFDDGGVKRGLNMPQEEAPLYIIAVGKI